MCWSVVAETGDDEPARGVFGNHLVALERLVGDGGAHVVVENHKAGKRSFGGLSVHADGDYAVEEAEDVRQLALRRVVRKVFDDERGAVRLLFAQERRACGALIWGGLAPLLCEM